MEKLLNKAKDIKIIFFDIDGTLLDHSIGMDSPSPKTIEAIRKLREKGYLDKNNIVINDSFDELLE